MSFSFGFIAASKAHARALLEETTVPEPVKTLVVSAINAVRTPCDGISVSGHGHLGTPEYEPTNVEFHVRPINTQPLTSAGDAACKAHPMEGQRTPYGAERQR